MSRALFCSVNKILSLFLFLVVFSESVAQSSWQQQVNFTISVKLDDNKHELTAFETFEYVNNSPDVLDKIYIHLWPNAYSSGKTALGKQIYRQGDLSLAYAGKEDLGCIDSLDFKTGEKKLRWQYLPEAGDVAVLMLDQPLGSGERIQISTPFRVKIPSGTISRMGHISQSYQITQWFPKPAVYDVSGWNWMSYLDQGEFYAEYGFYDVTITLPENYVVGATGNLQTESEQVFLDSMAFAEKKTVSSGKQLTIDFPPSSRNLKTIRYTQDRIHDFAWFADKRYEVLKSEVELPYSKRKVTTWAMYVPQNSGLWTKAPEYINDAVYHYSKWNGDYPYNQVTAVDGTISAGGGMEYPTITVIGEADSEQDLELVIVHEVGHNWFYGVLGSNERKHGWMDEGLNTLNEMRYFETKYPSNTYFSDMLMGGKFINAANLSYKDMADISCRAVAMMGEDQPVELPAEQFSEINYGIIMYQKTGLAFLYLKDYLGEELFDRAMMTYYERFSFRHPQPEDLRRVLEEVSGKNLGWLFDDLIQTTRHVDYKLKKVITSESGTKVIVKNTGQVNGPIGVTVLKDGQVVETRWSEPGARKRMVEFSVTEPDEVVIDRNNNNLETDRTNNNWNSSWLVKRWEPLRVNFMIGMHNRYQTNHFIAPALAYNNNDKFMLGITVHNFSLPQRRFQYALVPMYSFGRKFVSGTAEFGYTFLPEKTIRLIRVGTSLRSFKNDDRLKGNDAHINAVMPYLFMKLGNRDRESSYAHTLLLQTIYRNEYHALVTRNHSGAYIKYSGTVSLPDHELNFTARTDYMGDVGKNMLQNSVVRTSVEAVYKYRYIRTYMSGWIELRAFAGTFWNYSMADERYRYSLTGANGAQDVYFEDYFFDRAEGPARANSQRMDNMGGFGNAGNDRLTTDRFMTAVNVYIQLPLKPGILGIYADYGAFIRNNKLEGNYTDFGLALRFKKVFGIYFPLYLSQPLYTSYEGAKYVEKIRFSLRLNLVNSGITLKQLFK